MLHKIIEKRVVRGIYSENVLFGYPKLDDLKIVISSKLDIFIVLKYNADLSVEPRNRAARLSDR